MRSRGESARAWAEHALRGAALALVLWAMWRVVAANRTGGALALDGATVESEWPKLLDGTHRAAHLTRGTSLPADSTRDVLAAFAHAGGRFSWSGPPGAAIALSVERAREPVPSLVVRAVGEGRVTVRDGASVLDSTRDAAAGMTIVAVAAPGEVRATGGAGTAVVTPPPVRPLRSVLVFGRASWETKFTIAALEEDGWTVESRVSLAPRADMITGTRPVLDTAHYAAVVAIDSSVADRAAAIVTYVRSGGGLVLLTEAARLGGFAAMIPATVGARAAPGRRAVDPAAPLASLGVTPLTMRGGAVARETRGSVVTVAAQRSGAGRVAVVGYDELWRWRLEGGDDAVVAHRRWWSRLVGAVAADGGPAGSAAEGAPVARWRDALGAPTTAPPDQAPADALPPWLLPVLCAILLAEWGSRRTRGAR